MHGDTGFILHRGAFYPHIALAHLCIIRPHLVLSRESNCWDVLANPIIIPVYCDYIDLISTYITFYTRFILKTNIYEVSFIGCSSKFLVIFNLFIYTAEMYRADISVSNNPLLQTA